MLKEHLRHLRGLARARLAAHDSDLPVLHGHAYLGLELRDWEGGAELCVRDPLLARTPSLVGHLQLQAARVSELRLGSETLTLLFLSRLAIVLRIRGHLTRTRRRRLVDRRRRRPSPRAGRRAGARAAALGRRHVRRAAALRRRHASGGLRTPLGRRLRRVAWALA